MRYELSEWAGILFIIGLIFNFLLLMSVGNINIDVQYNQNYEKQINNLNETIENRDLEIESLENKLMNISPPNYSWIGATIIFSSIILGFVYYYSRRVKLQEEIIKEYIKKHKGKKQQK